MTNQPQYCPPAKANFPAKTKQKQPNLAGNHQFGNTALGRNATAITIRVPHNGTVLVFKSLPFQH